MQPAKQEALETIGKLPDDADMDEIMYRLYVLDKIRKGQSAADQGQTITSEAFQREIDTWWSGRTRPEKVAQDIAERAAALDELPRLGKVVPELDDEAIRKLSIYSYRIIYEIRHPGIVILAVIHQRRDFQPELLER